MTTEELIAFLKEKLWIELVLDPGENSDKLQVKLMLGDEVIDKDYVWLDRQR